MSSLDFPDTRAQEAEERARIEQIRELSAAYLKLLRESGPYGPQGAANGVYETQRNLLAATVSELLVYVDHLHGALDALESRPL